MPLQNQTLLEIQNTIMYNSKCLPFSKKKKKKNSLPDRDDEINWQIRILNNYYKQSAIDKNPLSEIKIYQTGLTTD